MGLLTRKDVKSSRRQAQRPRPSVSSEAQAASLRVRARRRLTGAVALVLAAVIVLPMLLDGEPRPVPAGLEIAVPKKTSTFNPDLSAQSANTDKQTSSEASTSVASGTVSGPSAAEKTETKATVASGASSGATSASAQSGTTAPTKAETAAAKPASEKPADSQAKPSAETVATKPAKSDNTAVAMAILEGRKPQAAAKPAAPANGDFIVQVAAYGAQSDADARRDKLKSQGISNAYVEATTSNGKTTYRLRVGPFGSREAAQAAQTRLRTLGYGDGLIVTK